MKAHWFQHVPFENLGSIEPWLVSKGYDITHTPFFSSAELPELEEIDLLVIMGGPMSVHDEDEHPWLVMEKEFIRSAIDAGKMVLGVCLGAQLIAHAMGARVFKNAEKEIGWLPIHASPLIDDSCFRFPPSANVFHWHGETFDCRRGLFCLQAATDARTRRSRWGSML
jgi:GMP synthase-like glutamine amidotransferase